MSIDIACSWYIGVVSLSSLVKCVLGGGPPDAVAYVAVQRVHEVQVHCTMHQKLH